MLGLPVLGAISWVMPQGTWGGVARLSAPFYAPMLTGDRGALERRIRSLLGDRGGAAPPDRIIAELVAEDLLAFLQLLREYRPGGSRPAIRLAGAEHIAEALEHGQGAVLWVGHFVHGSLVTKMACHGAGIAVSHLSHPRHGFSSTRFGMRVLNRVRTAVEDRYLRERVLLALDGSTAAMAALRRRLEENAVVSVTVGVTARRPVEAPFLDGRVRVAAGAPYLAYLTGARLLPVFTIREGGAFTVTVEPPLEVAAGAPRAEALEAAVHGYARRLEPYVLRHPGQWLGWLHP